MIPLPPNGVQEWSQVITGVVTPFLTLFLVILYKRQQEQLAAQHEALIEVTDVEWYQDNAVLWISNFGNGVAENLRLATLVESDTGDHREHTLRSNHLKRIDKKGEWTNLIQPGEENIPFEAKSRVGRMAPEGWSSEWVSFPFSSFVRKSKENGATAIKFCHVVRGTELSKNICWDRIDPMIQERNPQKFDRSHSLGNLPGLKKYDDDTFHRYFRYSMVRGFIGRIYIESILNIDRLLPRITLRTRVLDASGKRRVRRVFIRQRMKNGIGKIKQMFNTA